MAEPVAGRDTDQEHLERAAEIAHRGWGQVHPNPLVGCVLVRDGEVVGEGYHAVFGGPHAEVSALEAAGAAADGATAYVSLEPCAHHGKTPPCADALVAAGIKRVVIGAADPGAGSGGAQRLTEAGVEVVGPLWADRRAFRENPAFQHRVRTNRPYVALKLAVSADGMIAAGPGQRTDITGPETRREVHRLRSGFDAVMVGRGTLDADDPLLTVRDAPRGLVTPARLVLASDGQIPPDAALFRDAPDVPLHVFVREGTPAEVVQGLEQRGATARTVPAGPYGLGISDVLSACAEADLWSILCEGGAEVAGTLLRTGSAARIYLFESSVALGEEGVSAFDADGRAILEREYEIVDQGRQFGDDSLTVMDRREF